MFRTYESAEVDRCKPLRSVRSITLMKKGLPCIKKLAIGFYAGLCGWLLLAYCGTPLTVHVSITDWNASTLLLLFLLWGLFDYIRKWKYNDFSAFAVVLIWGANQYAEHWGPLFFGAPAARVRHYNEYFKGTLRLLPAESDRIVPDIFHIIIGLLLAVCIILLLVNSIRLLRAPIGPKGGIARYRIDA